MTARTWTLSSDGATVAFGSGEVAGYLALWTHTAGAVKFDMDFDYGQYWPVGRSFDAKYTLAFADSPPITIEESAGDVFVLTMWIVGTQGYREDFRLTRPLDDPNRDRVESFVRAYLRLGKLDAALKEIGVDYMRAIQDHSA